MSLIFVWAGLFLLLALLVGIFKNRWLLYLAQSSAVAIAVASLKTPQGFQILAFVLTFVLFAALDFVYFRKKITS